MCKGGDFVRFGIETIEYKGGVGDSDFARHDGHLLPILGRICVSTYFFPFE